MCGNNASKPFQTIVDCLWLSDTSVTSHDTLKWRSVKKEAHPLGVYARFTSRSVFEMSKNTSSRLAISFTNSSFIINSTILRNVYISDFYRPFTILFTEFFHNHRFLFRTIKSIHFKHTQYSDVRILNTIKPVKRRHLQESLS